MPHFENVTQIRADYPGLIVPGGQYGVIHERKKAVTGQIRSRCQKAKWKEKSDIRACPKTN
jgi:hypothetical protein